MINLKLRIIGIDAVHIRTHAAVCGMHTDREVDSKKISVRFCGMQNRAGQREVVKESFRGSAERLSPCEMQARARAK